MLLLIWVLLLSVLGEGEGVYCPHYCRCMVSGGLRHVQCVGRGLISVDLDVPRTVQWLQLSNNSIYALEDNIFEKLGLEHIVELNLDNNAIQSISLNAFAGLSELQFVDLSWNHLYYLPLGAFEKNPIVKYVSLRGNPLRYFQSAFVISNSISILDISNCRLNYLSEYSFNALPALIKLNISNNHIESLRYFTFENLTNLQELDISNNPFQCDASTKVVESWLETNHVAVIGSACQGRGKSPSPSSQMFEKMVMRAGDPVLPPREEFGGPNPYECDCNDSFYEQEEGRVEERESPPPGRDSVQVNYNPLFLVLSFVNGVIVGVASALSVWLCSRWAKTKARRRRLAAYNTIQDCPPPAYSDLF